MQTLCEGDDAFAHWYHLGRSRDEARTRKINVQDRPELLALLASGRNRRDTDNKVIENLGFHLWMWNGAEPGKEVNFNVKCGLFSEVLGLCNCAVLKLPQQLGRLADHVTMKKLLATMASSWEPDWAGIFSNDAMRSRNFEPKPFVDWMVYIPQKISSVPPPSTLTRLANGGSLIVVQPVPPILENPEDQKRIREIEQIVRQNAHQPD
jgi:hypothetical protein